jgi:hypothetical protein
MNGFALPSIQTPSWLRNRVVLPDSDMFRYSSRCCNLNLPRTKLVKLCRQHKGTHSRLDFRTFILLKEDLNEYLSRYRCQRKSVLINIINKQFEQHVMDVFNKIEDSIQGKLQAAFDKWCNAHVLCGLRRARGSFGVSLDSRAGPTWLP